MSTAAILAPRSLRARTAWVITLTWVLTALVPQMMTRSDFAISRGSGPARRPVPAQQALRMMHAFGIAGDLGANHARRVGVLLRAMDAADGPAVENLDLERTRRRAIVRAGGRADANR